MIRGLSAPVILPKVAGAATDAPGKVKFVLLNRLKNSARNWNLILSVTAKFLERFASVLNRRGPIRTSLPVLPKVPGAFLVNNAVLNHCWICAAWLRPEPR